MAPGRPHHHVPSLLGDESPPRAWHRSEAGDDGLSCGILGKDSAGLPPNHSYHKNYDRYILQVASLQNSADAKKLKLRLSSQGYRAFIQDTQINKTHWYRVLVGPYSSLYTVEQDQQRIRNKHFESIVLKTKL